MSDSKRPSYVLKRDLVIPAGTVFHCIDGTTRQFASGNFEATLGLSRDSSGSVVYGVEPNDAECMGDPWMIHKWGWTPKTIKPLLAETGFSSFSEPPTQWHGIGKAHRDFRIEARKG